MITLNNLCENTCNKITNLEAAIEAILFANGNAVSVSKLAQALNVKKSSINQAALKLAQRLDSPESGIQLLCLEDKFQLCTKSQFADQIRAIMDIKKRAPLSNAAMEVIAIIAYNQPVTKAFIEQIRGVDCSAVLSSLVEKDLVEEKGRLDLPGRPLLYGTTDNFLRCFQLSNLDELPSDNSSSCLTEKSNL